ncbi:Carotenoid oxygenase [Corchorus capsularis]|uniref:Carotenoid oxygenase n=1 Tax=Corchorus capsularis TaxID=210143 RepID=A0A1R3IMT3_COCAP|nr:Carotenoid oxygenase [Corchorus capsularis]
MEEAYLANAWEEDDEIVLITCRLEIPDLDMVNGEVYEMRFNIKTGVATQKKLSESVVDFPRVNEDYIGRHFVNLQKLYQAKSEADFLAIEQVLGIFKLAEIQIVSQKQL